MKEKKLRWAVVLVAIVGLAAGSHYRFGLWVLLTQVAPPSLLADTDEGNYFRIAKKISDGKIASDDAVHAVSYRSVVFPLLAAPLLKAFHFDSLVLQYTRLLVALWGIFTCLIGFHLVHSIVGPRWRLVAATGAMLLLLFDSQLATWSAEFLTDGPAVGLLLASIARLIAQQRQPQGNIPADLGTGALFGLTALVKFDYLYVLWLLIAYSLVTGWREHRHVPRNVALAAVIYALILGAYGLRNLAHTGEFFITSKDAVNLWIGNNPGATGRYYPGFSKPDLNELLAPSGRPPSVASPPSAEGRPVLELRLREWARQQALHYLRNQPLAFARGLARKFWLFVTACHEPQFAFLGKASLLMTVMLELGVVLALWGVLTSRWRRQFRLELGFLLVAYGAEMFVLVAVFVDPRLMLLNFALGTLITGCVVGELLGSSSIPQRRARRNPAQPEGLMSSG